MDKSEKMAIYSMAVNGGVFILKSVAAVLSGSLAVKAEVLHTFTDVLASATVLIGLKIAKRKSKQFPYGLYKVENVFSVLMSLLICYSGYEIFQETWYSTDRAIAYIGAAAVGMGLSAWLLYGFSRYEKRVGKELQSPILMADAMHMQTDVISNLLVFGAVLGQWASLKLDQFAAIFVVFFILKTAWKIFLDGMRVLLDASLDAKTLSDVETLVKEMPLVSEVKALTGRNSGQFKFIEMAVALKTTDLNKAHFVTKQIEARVRSAIRHVDRVLVHYEPTEKDVFLCAVPMEEGCSSISEHFGKADCFMLCTVRKKDGAVLGKTCKKNPYCRQEKGRGIMAAEFLIKEKIDILFIQNSLHNKGPLYALENGNIQVASVDEISHYIMVPVTWTTTKTFYREHDTLSEKEKISCHVQHIHQTSKQKSF